MMPARVVAVVSLLLDVLEVIETQGDDALGQSEIDLAVLLNGDRAELREILALARIEMGAPPRRILETGVM